MGRQEVLFRDLGQMRYKEAWDYQEELLQKNVAVKARIRARKRHWLVSRMIHR